MRYFPQSKSQYYTNSQLGFYSYFYSGFTNSALECLFRILILQLFPVEIYQTVCWWYTYPSEKYEFVSWDDDIPNILGKS